MNIVMFNNLINRYNAVSFTHNYIFGFIDRGVVYSVTTTSEILPFVCCLDKASSKNGGGYSLRFVPTKAQKEMLKTAGVLSVVCSADYFNTLVSESKYNKGEIFEKLITEKAGCVWVKDNVPFTKDGDVTINGIPYQVKFQKASFCSESSLANLGA